MTDYPSKKSQMNLAIQEHGVPQFRSINAWRK